MNRLLPATLLLLISFSASAQLIKPKMPRPKSRLDSVFTSEQFRYETLDSIYRFFSARFRAEIHYDTAYARRHSMTYWFMNTPVSRALEITTYDQRLNCRIDSLGIVTIRRRGRMLGEDPDPERPPVHARFAGPPVRRHFALSGKVVDFHTGIALAGAALSIPSTGELVPVDAAGYFRLPDVAADTIAINATASGYLPLQVFLSPEVPLGSFIIEMEADANHQLDGVVVTAARADVSLQSADAISTLRLTPAKLSELPNLGEKDIMRSMQLLPGVSAAHESSSGLYVRGGTPDQNLVLFDGFTVYHVDHLYGFYSAFNANAIRDMQLYKGGFDARFGGRLSSVTEMSGKEGDHKKFSIGGDFSLLSGNVFTEIPLSEKITITVAARRSWKGPIYNWIFNKLSSTDADASGGDVQGGMGAVTTTTSYFSDVNARISYLPSKQDELAFSYFTSNDYLENQQTVGFGRPGGGPGGFGGNNAVDKTTYANRGLSLRHARSWTNRLNSATTLAYSNYFSDRDRSNARTTVDSATGESTTVSSGVFEKNDLKDLSLRSDWDLSLGRHHQLGFGVFATAFDITYSYAEDDTSTVLDRNDAGLLAGVYMQDRIRFLKGRAELKPGIRASYYDLTSQSYLEPRLALSYKAGSHVSLKAAYGDYYQFANQITREDLLNGNKEFWILSDGVKVPVSKATHYIGGISWENAGFLFSAEAYYKALSNLTQYSLRFSSLRNNGSYSESFYTGNGYARGLELLAQKKTGRLTGWVSYAFGQARNRFEAYGADYFPANQDVTNELKIVGIYKLGKWDLSATWIYATGRPYTAPGGSYSVTLLDGTTRDYFTVTSQNSLRLPDYHRLDLAVNRHFYNERGQDVGYAGFSLFNAYNRSNIWYKQFYLTESGITETAVNYLGITPNISLSFKLHQ